MVGVDNDTSLLYCDDDAEEQDAFEAVIESADLGLHGGGSAFTGGSSGSPSVSKCLIFAQFTKSLDAVEELLFKPHLQALRYIRLDGSVPPEKRMQVVNTFNEEQDVRVLLLTTRVGGLGLNLTAANTVIFLESDYNPFADLQAMDRCRRIGQTKVVNIYKLVSEDTIEEKILVLQEKKMKVADSVVNTDNSTMYRYVVLRNGHRMKLVHVPLTNCESNWLWPHSYVSQHGHG
jgi:TATA-binding protein-associated factor